MKRSRRLASAAALLMTLGAATPASAYIGESFMAIPGIAGGWQGQQYKDWIKVDAHVWKSRPSDASQMFRRKPVYFSAPFAPRKGADTISIQLDKRSPAYAALMERCTQKAKIPELNYAESSELARPVTQYGPRPAEFPEFYEYKLKDVALTCPVVADAPDQGFIMDFADIEWLNYKGEGDGKEVVLQPADLPPLKISGETKSYVMTWFGPAHDVSDDQCPVVNTKPLEEEYYALMDPAAAAKERAELAASKKGGVNYEGQMSFRGPNKLSVCLLPGLTSDKRHYAPQATVARGVNLDGDEGTGAAPANTCKHTNYVATDGRKGIDNQLYTVQGCVPAYMGHKGFLMQYGNEQRRNGRSSTLIKVDGIDHEQNDDLVYVTVLYSKDPMQKDGSGARILHDYTFRLTDDLAATAYVTRLKGRIENGAIVTDSVPELQLKTTMTGAPENFYNAVMRLEIMPDGAMKGVVAGYQKWRELMTMSAVSDREGLYGFKCPAMYDAFKRAADGLKNSVTGECDGISAAYDIEGVPAFIPPSQQKAFVADAGIAR